MSQNERKKFGDLDLGEFDPLNVLDNDTDPEEEYSVSRAREALRVVSEIASTGVRSSDNESRVEQGVLDGYQDDLKSSQVSYARYQAWRRDQALDLLNRVEKRLLSPGRPLSNQDLLRLRDSLAKEVNDSTQNIDRVIDGPPVIVDNRSINLTVEGASKEDRASRAAMLDLLQAIDIELSSIINSTEEENSDEILIIEDKSNLIEEEVIVNERDKHKITESE
ncbi:MAG: hypothetical protein ACO3L1_00125 [Flavobacteriaceae bacterium]